MSEHIVPHILYRWDEGHPQPAWDNPHYTNLHDKVSGKKSLYLPETKSSHGPTPSLRKLHAYLIYKSSKGHGSAEYLVRTRCFTLHTDSRNGFHLKTWTSGLS